MAVMAAPLPLKQGLWKIEMGGGRLVFADGIMSVKDYEAWTLVQYGANTDAGQFRLTGYSGLLVEVQVEETTDLEVAVQLEDWAFQVVHKETLAASGGWATMEVDLSGLDLSVINALCLQGSGADFSVRSILPISRANGEGPTSSVKIGGKANFDFTVHQVEIVPEEEIGESVIAFNDADWQLAEGSAKFGENSVEITSYPGWKWLEREIGAELDLTAYTGVQFEVKVEAPRRQIQFIFLPDGDWGKKIDLHVEDHTPEDGWQTVAIDFASISGLTGVLQNVTKILFQGGEGDWSLRNIVLLKEAEELQPIYQTGLEREYAIELNLTYTINDEWEAYLSTTVAEQSFRVGLVELKGTPGEAVLRFFANGTGSDLGDPLQSLQGSKYYEDESLGLDWKQPLAGNFAHLFLSTPVKPHPGDSLLAGATVRLPVEQSTEVQILGAAEVKSGLEEKAPYLLGAVINTTFNNGITSTGEALFSGKQGLGFYGEVAWEGLKAGLSHIPAGLWTERGNFSANDGYGTYFIQGDAQLLDHLEASFYFNQWYNHQTGDEFYKNYLLKLNTHWSGEKVDFKVGYEHKKQLNTETGKYDQLENSKLLLTLQADPLPDLTGKLMGIITHEGGQILQVPALVSRLSYTGVKDWAFVGELGLSKASSTDKLEKNLFARAQYKFAPDGSLEFAIGKPTLNADDNTVVNRSFAKHYYTLKFRFNF